MSCSCLCLTVPSVLSRSVDHLLNEAISVPVSEDHALPWYPPVCEPAPGRVALCDSLPTVRGRGRISQRRSDPVASAALMAYARGRTTVEAELGQRITSALKQVGCGSVLKLGRCASAPCSNMSCEVLDSLQ